MCGLLVHLYKRTVMSVKLSRRFDKKMYNRLYAFH